MQLRLVDEQQLEYELASGRLNEALVARFARPLDTLQSRLQTLSEAMRVPAGANPIGPDRLVAAFAQTFLEAQVPDTLRARLFRHYEQDLVRLLGDLYARVNTLLATAGYGSAGTATPRPRAEEVRRERGYGEGFAPGPGFHGMPGGSGDGFAGPNGASSFAHASAAGNFGRTLSTPMSNQDIAAMASELAELRGQLHAWRESLPQAEGGASARARLVRARDGTAPRTARR